MQKLLILMFFMLFNIAFASHEYKESYYQEKWCNEWGGLLEYKLNDETRVDCLTKTYAVEFDFAPKWAESVGQSLYYALETGKKPAIVLILEDESDKKYVKRAKKLANLYDIQLWEMKKPNIKPKEYDYSLNLKNELYKLISSFIKSFVDDFLRKIFV